MGPGIVLVHGYTGSPRELGPLNQRLMYNHGPDSVTTVCLPGHNGSGVPPFDKGGFVDAIAGVVDGYIKEGREIILIGLSTGGTLLLAAIAHHAWSPRLLILAATPKIVGSEYLDRWSRHSEGGMPVSLTAIARMVSLINTTGSFRYSGTFPVLIMQGDDDDLVVPQDASLWLKDSFQGPVGTVFVKGAGHNLFCGDNNKPAIDAAARAIHRVLTTEEVQEDIITAKLLEVEPEAGVFLRGSPQSVRHLALSPGGQPLGGFQPLLSSTVPLHPVFANIEITTRCDFNCRYCARSFAHRPPGDMEGDAFRRILDILPHAYRVTLVGLGEPLLHPGVVDFVNEATSRGRWVAMVTNGLHLDPSLSERLIEAGLRSIAFSIDAADEKTATDVRHGTDLPRVIENIKGFMEIALTSGGRGISTAIFAAVSIRTAPLLEQLIDLAARCGVHVLMLTDLNFEQNLSDSLWKNLDDGLYDTLRAAISRAFLKGLPLLSVHGLEEFGLRSRYRDFLLLSPNQLSRRSATRRWCYSPWQTMPVDVNGNATICDCQPEKITGNLLNEPFEAIWNGERMAQQRHEMLSGTPPQPCTICPRF